MDSEPKGRPQDPPSATNDVQSSSDPLGPSASAANRPTCDSCRRRKVKCDRQQPCSVCIQSNSDCVYPSRRGRAPKRFRRSVDVQLAARLSHLDTLIKRFEKHTVANGKKTAPENQLLDSNQLESPAIDLPINSRLGRLIIDDSRSYYVSNDLWGSLAGEITELRNILLEPATEDENEDGNHQFLDALNDSSLFGSSCSIFGFRAIAHSLLPYYPPASHSTTLFALFTENVAPLIRIFHMPTLFGIYQEAIACLDTIDTDTEALLFAIYYSAIISISSDQCLSILGTQRSTTLAQYRFLVEQALARANFLNTQSTMLLQAAILFVSSFRNQDNSRTSWSLTALIFHIAQAMGLHRDGKLFSISPFQTEIRRRMWWQICILDSRGSEYHGYEPIVHGGETSFDTRLPLHVNDSDLYPDMVEEPAEQWDTATDMTLTLIRCEAMRTGWKFSQLYPKLQRKSVNGAARKVSLEDREVLVRELQQTLEGKYLSCCDVRVPYQLVSFAVGSLVISRFWLVVHFPSKKKEEKDTSLLGLGQDLNPEMRDRLFSASIDILEWSSVLLNEEGQARWSWYAKTHIQWHTMAFVLSELCSRTPSPEYFRAWACITTVYAAWETEHSEKDIMSGPIRQLMARARYVQQIQGFDIYQEQNIQQTSLTDAGHQSFIPVEQFGQQSLTASNLVWPPGVPSFHSGPIDRLEEVFERTSLDHWSGISPELPFEIFGSLVGSGEPLQSLDDKNTTQNWKSF